jgi:hypothetical protein
MVVHLELAKEGNNMTNSMYYDRHHLCYPRNSWNYGFAKKLRNMPYLIAEVERETVHQTIHACVPYVPVPSGQACSMAIVKLHELYADNVIGDNDSLSKRLSVLINIFSELDPDVAYAFEEQLKVVCKFEASII